MWWTMVDSFFAVSPNCTVLKILCSDSFPTMKESSCRLLLLLNPQLFNGHTIFFALSTAQSMQYADTLRHQSGVLFMNYILFFFTITLSSYCTNLQLNPFFVSFRKYGKVSKVSKTIFSLVKITIQKKIPILSS